MITTQILLGVNEDDLKEVRAIRHTVFCVEQQIDENIEKDGCDPSAVHVLVCCDNLPAATGRLLVQDEFIIGRVAVLPEYRGRRIGDLVVRLLIRTAYEMGGEQQVAHVQLGVKGFYDKLGFKAVGDIYEEAGIEHITMVHNGDVAGKCEDSRQK